MAKPIIKFSGAKFVTGGVTGYRPQLEKATKVTDLALAEEICLEKRLALSPDELLHAVKTTLETAPQLMMADGRVREFTNLLRWNRSASGRLDGPAGAWNATCKAYIKAQLLKDSKGQLDATFVNTETTPTPKVDNVTWIGAVGMVNCVKQYQPFAAYGRHMQFISGDTAKLIVNGTDYWLTCTSSDSAHAVFNWPATLTTFEDGTEATFVMASRGGFDGNPTTVNTKKVVLLAGSQIVAETSDHVGKVKTFKCNGSTTFVLGEWFTATTENIFDEDRGSGWYLHGDSVLIMDSSHQFTVLYEGNAGGTEVNFDTSEIMPMIQAGTYANAQVKMGVKRSSDGREELLFLPCPMVVEPIG